MIQIMEIIDVNTSATVTWNEPEIDLCKLK